MTINHEIKGILNDMGIPYGDGVAYLIMLHYDLDPSFIPDKLKTKMNATGIYGLDNNNSFQWHIPLFNEMDTNFDWVKKEYVQMFKDANSTKAGNGNSAVRNMKKFFAQYPDIRKDEVLGATKYYILSTNPQYIRLSHYFIFKGRGVDRISDLHQWVQNYRERIVQETGRQGLETTMQ